MKKKKVRRGKPFMDSVHINTETGCWEWLGASTGRGGYGIKVVENKRILAHRLSYEMFREKIPAGLTMDHLCRTHKCVNPWHLEPVSQKINILRGHSPSALHAKQTHCQGGHPYTGGNLQMHASKYGRRRVCRECARASYKRWYYKERGNN